MDIVTLRVRVRVVPSLDGTFAVFDGDRTLYVEHHRDKRKLRRRIRKALKSLRLSTK